MHDRRFPISQVHKLEDPERRKWLPPDEVIRLLDIHANWTIADIGAGTGYFTLPMARIAAKVLAVDVEPGMLARIETKLIETELNNVTCLQGEASATGLDSSSCDCILLANVWHEFDDHVAVLAEAARILKPNGLLAVLDWRADLDTPPGPPQAHRIPKEIAQFAISEGGFRVRTVCHVGTYSWLLLASRAREGEK
jgi:ubiquinone/menaquinone biosynthesis C-methylase UbiE